MSSGSLTWPVGFPCMCVLHVLWQNAPIVMNRHALCCHTGSFHWLCFLWSSCRMCGGLFAMGLLTDSRWWCSEMEDMREKKNMNEPLKGNVVGFFWFFFFMVTLVIWLPVALNSKARVNLDFHDSCETLRLLMQSEAQPRSPLTWRQFLV